MMEKRYKPELGQALFGNKWGSFPITNLGEACIDHVLKGMSRIFWNREQRAWDKYEDPKIFGIEFRPYYWGDIEEETEKPNMKAAGVEIRWYEHPGRGMSVNKEMSAVSWEHWLNTCMLILYAAEEEENGVEKV